VPAGVTAIQAAVNKIAAIAHHGVHRAGLQPDDRVAVVGLGLLGQLVARIAQPRCRLTCLDLAGPAVDLALAAGLEAERVDAELEPALGRLSASLDAILDVTGVPAVPARALTMLKDLPWGDGDLPMPRYVIQGSYAGDITIPYQPAFKKEMLTLLPRDNGDADRHAVLALLADGSLCLENLIDDLRPAADAPATMRDLARGALTSPTVVFRWAEE
jgi:threonine dehydrogenase-like Zn-dependent dehydrogenase